MFRRVAFAGRRACSAVKEVATKEGARSSDGFVTLPGILAAGIAGGTVVCAYMLMKESDGETKLKAMAAKRMSSSEKRVDPALLSNEVGGHIRNMDPEASPQLVQLGVALALEGLTDSVKAHECFGMLQELKESNEAMSWCDFGAFVAFHALLEMGAPLVLVEPRFGRSDAESKGRTPPKPLPKPDAGLAEVLAFGKQFNLTVPETVAILGGQESGSLLFGDSKERELSTNFYRRVINATSDELATGSLPFGAALASDPDTRKCCILFGSDNLYWNRYFVSALGKVLAHNWTNLVELPKRMRGSTDNLMWSTRQKQMYGVAQPYEGSSHRHDTPQ